MLRSGAPRRVNVVWASERKDGAVDPVPVTGHGVHDRRGIAASRLGDWGVHGSLKVVAFACDDSNRALANRHTSAFTKRMAWIEWRHVSARRASAGLRASCTR